MFGNEPEWFNISGHKNVPNKLDKPVWSNSKAGQVVYTFLVNVVNFIVSVVTHCKTSKTRLYAFCDKKYKKFYI